MTALARYFPAEAKWTHPEGGMFLLVVSLPDRSGAAAWLELALLNNVAFAPADDFHPDGAAQLLKRVF